MDKLTEMAGNIELTKKRGRKGKKPQKINRNDTVSTMALTISVYIISGIILT